jgi:hypothetical protein
MTQRQWPTLAEETIRARQELTLAQSIAMALRSHRGTLGEGQRDYAERRGWSAAHQARLERDPDNRKLAQIMEALDGTGFRLALLREHTGAESAPESWPTSELVARDAAGRRLPAHVVAHRLWSVPSWYIVRHGFWGPSPDWSWPRPSD